MSRTLLVFKPEAVGLYGKLMTRFERAGFRMINSHYIAKPNEAVIHQHYAEHAGKSFYESYVAHMTKGPLFVSVWAGDVVRARTIVGNHMTPGTIRGDYGIDRTLNMVHASDSAEAAEREIALWFDR